MTPSSAVAYRLCQAIATDRPSAPQVLLLHGSTGTGKTHLLHAMAHAKIQARSGVRARISTAVELSRELTLAIREDRIADMRRRPEIDLLIVDDLHQLVARPGTQAGLGTTLAAWVSGGLCVCGGSSAHSSVLTAFSRALRRTASIRWTEVKRPVGADARAIASALSVRETFKVPADTLRRVARESGGDIRRIVGLLAHRRAMETLPGAPVAPPWMEEFHSC
jgi:chromosomal replication initiator protein